ncbi:S-adenosyl-L-methionine-dependent methyltransferase [Schizophyllum amplum]|uniref:DNA (cytosine-5-)-methyltransferase n=1 Tax=Schizophyllum amplum TaxID=97359 RepID=A0A550BWR5_9AGAR|nr:S-adenosyl-L-methionine-dependent methyltransferase [Auriculariopsis ampla]
MCFLGWNISSRQRSIKLRSTDVSKGCAPHYAVTIGDAIGDLKRFHWYAPCSHDADIAPDKDPHDNIPKVKVDAQKRIIGYTDVARAYEWEPRNAFQAAARRNGKVHDMQHYTRVYEAENSKCVVNIPMLPNADARHLSRNYHTYMLHNPISANAQGGYNKAYFGRLDEKGIFMTVSTNIGPKAKQSRCLNPWCRRLVTVRELARAQGFPDSFVFKSVKGEYDVETMHKQIGNALAWPVAVALGRELRHAMLKDWIRKREDAIVID